MVRIRQGQPGAMVGWYTAVFSTATRSSSRRSLPNSTSLLLLTTWEPHPVGYWSEVEIRWNEVDMKGVQWLILALIWVPGSVIASIAWCVFVYTTLDTPYPLMLVMFGACVLFILLCADNARTCWQWFINEQEDERVWYEDSEIPWDDVPLCFGTLFHDRVPHVGDLEG